MAQSALSGSNLVGSQYVDRGDPATIDFDETALTTDGTWRDLDLSSIVPPDAKLVSLWIRVRDDAAGSSFSLRQNGNTNANNRDQIITQVANVWNSANMLVTPDTSGVVEYLADNLTWTDIWITVRGWWI